jgi:hypothetical protein
MTCDETKRERHARLKRELQARRRAAGLCTVCGAGLTDDREGMCMCVECAEKHAMRRRQQRQRPNAKEWRRQWARTKYQTDAAWRERERLRVKIYQATRSER